MKMNSNLLKQGKWANYALALIALIALCSNATSEEHSADYWYKKGWTMMGKIPLEEVIKAYEMAIELNPNNATYWAAKGHAISFLAFVASNQSKYNESLEAYNKAIQLAPKDPRIWDLMGSTFFQMKMYNESLAARDKAIQNIDNYQGGLPVTKTELLAGIWTSKGVILLEAGRIDEAFEAFDKALMIDPGNYNARMMKAQATGRLGRYNKSITI